MYGCRLPSVNVFDTQDSMVSRRPPCRRTSKTYLHSETARAVSRPNPSRRSPPLCSSAEHVPLVMLSLARTSLRFAFHAQSADMYSISVELDGSVVAGLRSVARFRGVIQWDAP